MADPRTIPVQPMAKIGHLRLYVVLLWLLGLCAGATFNGRAALQFDVFVGYDGVVPEASWFPVTCEVKNDGPPFTAVVEISSGNYNQGQTRRALVELPTGSLKRFVIPVFSTTRFMSTWDARLLNERGKVVAEQLNLQPKKRLAWESPLLGALPRTVNGAPIFQPILPKQTELQPVSARLQPSLFPDNPLVLESLDALYLNSDRAAELKDTQVKALLAWLYAGGHLIVAVEQSAEVNANPWLRKLFPCELAGVRTIERHSELQDWLRGPRVSSSEDVVPAPNATPKLKGKYSPKPNVPEANPFYDLADDPAFESAGLQVVTGKLSDGHALVSAQEIPLIVTADRGRGRVTGLMFSPEREPFRLWKNLPSFWAKMAEVPPAWYAKSDLSYQGGWSTDGIFGAMIDSKQVRKLPVGWLLLLLLVYLLVIGPLDQFWLKRIGRPMLTWLTFPCYVVLFSVVIYFIGYKLRAGESEWNELHLVDVLVNGERAELRGRTYASVYSPINEKYMVESQQRFAALRGEFVGSWGGGQESERANVLQHGDNFSAEIFVPVWTSQLYVSDWWQPSALPLNVTVVSQGANWQVTVDNRLERKLTRAQLVIADRVIDLAELPPKQSKTFTVSKSQGMLLKDFVLRYGATFQGAVQQRQRAFGSDSRARIDDVPNGAMAVSFVSQLAQRQQPQQYNYLNFIAPPGLDLSSLVARGQAVLLAWEPDYSPIKPLNQFTPRRSHRDTLWRVAVAISPQS